MSKWYSYHTLYLDINNAVCCLQLGLFVDLLADIVSGMSGGNSVDSWLEYEACRSLARSVRQCKNARQSLAINEGGTCIYNRAVRRINSPINKSV